MGNPDLDLIKGLVRNFGKGPVFRGPIPVPGPASPHTRRPVVPSVLHREGPVPAPLTPPLTTTGAAALSAVVPPDEVLSAPAIPPLSIPSGQSKGSQFAVAPVSSARRKRLKLIVPKLLKDIQMFIGPDGKNPFDTPARIIGSIESLRDVARQAEKQGAIFAGIDARTKTYMHLRERSSSFISISYSIEEFIRESPDFMNMRLVYRILFEMLNVIFADKFHDISEEVLRLAGEERLSPDNLREKAIAWLRVEFDHTQYTLGKLIFENMATRDSYFFKKSRNPKTRGDFLRCFGSALVDNYSANQVKREQKFEERCITSEDALRHYETMLLRMARG